MAKCLIDARRLGVALFDMDGVVTNTARVHERAWRIIFDPILAQRDRGAPFSHKDYVRHADGKSRRDEARAFLAAPRGGRGTGRT